MEQAKKTNISVRPLLEHKTFEMFETKAQYINNYYNAGFSWKEKEPSLPYNKSLALS